MTQTFTALFIATYLGHTLADYLLQNNRLATGKLDTRMSGFWHACEHAGHVLLAQLAWIGMILIGTDVPLSLFGVIAALAINVIPHLFIDWAERGPRWWVQVNGDQAEYYDHSQPTADRLSHTHGVQNMDQAMHRQLMGLGALVGALLS